MMPDDPRVQQLLEELLDSGCSPDEVCRSCPELLPLVRKHWQRLRELQTRIDALFPESGATFSRCHAPTVPSAPELPKIPGYEVQAVPGHGGMGIVYKAWHLRLNRVVALKMLLAGAYARPEERERFFRETEAVASLNHANIVQIYDAGEQDGWPYFTMEFVEGGSLAQKLARTPQPPRAAASLMAILAGAIQAAHQSGIVHRDLTPANILLTADGTPKIADFGLARRLEGGMDLSRSGVAMGTPSYMAPEQARGQKDAIGPATDVYALGVILYEMLTGRPPFHAETAVETHLLVIKQDPVPPSWLVAKVPRDLETICLKCLQKDPQRRYSTAAALADDLQRFLRGEPIAARRTGRLATLAKWMRRHPALAAHQVAILLLALTLVGEGGWLIGKRISTERAVEEELRKAVRLQEQSAFDEAGAALERAKSRLGSDGPAWLYPLLNEARRDQQFLVRLEGIRLNRCTVVEGRFNHAADERFRRAQADRDYEEAFRDRELCEPANDPEGVATRLKASALRALLLAAFDDWAVCATDKVRQDWLLSVVRQTDPDPWRDRVRDPAVWGDGKALSELARTAPLAEQPVPFLLALGERLQNAGGDGTRFLRQVQEAYPEDFWTNFTLARTLHGAERHRRGGDPAPAVVYYQQAIKLRPRAVAVLNDLGLVLVDKYWMRDDPSSWGSGAITVYRQALEIDRTFAPTLNNLGLALKVNGTWGEALPLYLKALRINPRLAPTHFNLAEVLAGKGLINDAIDYYRQTLQIDPEFARAHYFLGIALLAKGRWDEVVDSYPEIARDLDRMPGFGSSEVIIRHNRMISPSRLDQLRDAARSEVADYYNQAQNFKPEWSAARNRLRLSPQDDARLNEAIGHYRQAIRLEPDRPLAYGALGQALLAKRQFAEAEDATRRSLKLLRPEEWDFRPNLERQQQRCRNLLDLEGRLPAIVQGSNQPSASECLDAAELCFVKRHYATAARLYVQAFTVNGQLYDDVRAGHRLNAACAAALAGCGRGDDVANLGEPELQALRNRAREYLRLDLDAWAKKLETGAGADRILAQKALSKWRDDPDLAGVRDPDALDKLSPAERQACSELWRDLDALLARVRNTR